MSWAAQPWDAPFNKDAAAILKAASGIKAPDSSEVIVLLDEQHYTIDNAGRTTATRRKVYRVLSADAVEYWSSVEQEYAPWHEQKPELRARVITPDAMVHSLDSKTIADSPAEEFEANVFSDTRVARAPLPSVAAGAVVEYEFTVRETAPALAAGVARRINLVDTIATERVHIIVEAPAGIALRTKARRIAPDAMRRTESKRGVQVECDFGPIIPRKNFVSFLPSTEAAYPVFEFSSGNWQQIAASYDAIVNRQIAGADLSALALPGPAQGDARAIAARLAAALHQRIRYTGVEFGQAAIVPQPPAEVLRRGYGDCKDKASLLVALLRAAGLKANVALLLSGSGLDIDPEMPGFNLFDHAIVYVEANPPLWIDATSPETRVGNLPLGDQGRLALVASATTTAPLKIPESQSADNRVVHTVEFRLSDYGRASVKETVEGYGAFETQLRSAYGNPVRLRENLEAEVKRAYAAEALGEYSITAKDDFSTPFRMTLEARNSSVGMAIQDDAFAFVQPALVLQNLPYSFLEAASSDADPRTQDFVFGEPYQAEFRYRVIVPPFFHARTLPSSEESKIGTATFSRDFHTSADGTVEAVFRFDSGKRRITAAEFESLRDGLKKIARTPESIAFVSAASEALALGKTKEAVQLVRDYVNKEPESAGAQARLAYVLTAAGAGDAAVTAALKAVELDPKSSPAWQALGSAYTYDSFGRQYRGSWNSAEAEKAFRRALEIEPDGLFPGMNLAALLEHNAQGEYHGRGARFSEAIDIYRRLLKKEANPAIQQNLAVDLVYSLNLTEAEPELKKLPPSQVTQTLTLAVATLKNGSARTIIDSQSDFPEPSSRALALSETANMLGTLRRYDLALDLLKAAQRISTLPGLQARLDAFAKAKPYEQWSVPPSDPRHPVQQLVLLMLRRPAETTDVRSLFAAKSASSAESILAGLRRGWAGARAPAAGVPLSSDVLVDSMVSGLELDKDGEDSFGYRVWAKSSGGLLPDFFVVKEEGRFRILATSDRPDNIGTLVLDLLEAKDLKSAQRWLDWLVSGSVVSSGGSMTTIRVVSTGTGGSLIRFLWSGVNEQGRSAAVARVAAAALVGQYSASNAAIEVLKTARAAAANGLDRAQIDLALCEAYQQAGRWSELLTAAKQIAGNFQVGDRSFEFVVKARSALKQWQELEQDALVQLKAKSGDARALNAAATAAISSGNHEKASEYLKQLTALQFAGKEEHLLNGWHALMLNEVSPSVLDALARDRNSYNIDPDVDFVIGLLQAATGKAEEAKRSLTLALDADDSGRFDAKPFVLQGKLDELYGLAEAAEAAYAKARSAPHIDETSDWAIALIPTAATPRKLP